MNPLTAWGGFFISIGNYFRIEIRTLDGKTHFDSAYLVMDSDGNVRDE